MLSVQQHYMHSRNRATLLSKGDGALDEKWQLTSVSPVCASFNLRKCVKACCCRVVFYMQELRGFLLL